jgi:hypothetical protein
MKETDKEAAERIAPLANDNDAPEGRQAAGSLDPRIRIIARAIGRHIAREHIRAWEKERREQAANDNGQE